MSISGITRVSVYDQIIKISFVKSIYLDDNLEHLFYNIEIGERS